EARQRRERDVVGAPDAGLQHPAAPDRHLLRLRERLDLFRFAVAADATELDVDDAARAQLQGVPRAGEADDGFVEADRGVEAALQLGVIDEVARRERLLDHQEAEWVEFLEERA